VILSVRSVKLVVLGAFAKLRKVTINFFMSVCLSEWNNSARTGQILIKFYIFLQASVQKIKLSLNPVGNEGYFTWRRFHIYDNISPNSSENEKCSRQKLFRKSEHTFYVQCHFSENRAVCEIMSKNFVEPERPLMTLSHMRYACQVSEATRPHEFTRVYTHNSCLSTAKFVSWTLLNVTTHVHCFPCYKRYYVYCAVRNKCSNTI
jgi:hypothetical protein